MQDSISKKKEKRKVNVRIEKQTDLEHPPPKGIHKQGKITKMGKITKSHKAIQ
jgi:hypothetical protein